MQRKAQGLDRMFQQVQMLECAPLCARQGLSHSLRSGGQLELWSVRAAGRAPSRGRAMATAARRSPVRTATTNSMRPTELQDIVQYSGRRAAWRTMAAAGQQLRHPNNNFLHSDPTDHSPARQVPCMKRSRKAPPRARWHSAAVASAVASYCRCYPLARTRADII